MFVVMGAAHIKSSDPVSQFRAAMVNAGIEPPEVIEADGRLHRFSTNGRSNDDAGWYMFHLDNLRVGTFNYWRAGVNETGDTKPQINITNVAGLP